VILEEGILAKQSVWDRVNEARGEKRLRAIPQRFDIARRLNLSLRGSLVMDDNRISSAMVRPMSRPGECLLLAYLSSLVALLIATAHLIGRMATSDPDLVA